MLLVPTLALTTIMADSLDLNSVNKAVHKASNGDTVVLPAGTVTWKEPCIVNKSITLAGAGMDKTSIVVGGTGRPNLRAFVIAAKSTDVIPGTSTNPISRLTGLSITGINGQGPNRPQGIVVYGGTSHQFRVDHIKISNFNEVLIQTYGYLWGVIDHCQFYGRGTSELHMRHNAWPAADGSAATGGNGSWADDPHWCSEKFIFIEDCYFNNVEYCLDGQDGARVVFRHNTVSQGIGMHGTDSGTTWNGPFHRGARMAEIYNNISDSALYRAPVGAFAVQIRSGSRLIYNNLFKNWTNTGVIKPNVYRSFTPYQVWGGATGVNPWDQNDPKLYAAGTVSGPSVGLSVVLPLQGLSANQYNHYTLRNMSPGNTPRFSIITGNTPSQGNSSTFTYAGSAGKASMMFKAGDKFEIRRVLAVMDSPATGKGDLLKVGLRGLINTASGSATWPRNSIEGVYVFNSKVGTFDGPDIHVSSGQTLPNLPSQGIFTDGSVPKGYRYDPSETGTPYERVGAEGIASYPTTTCTGGGGYTYPHPLVRTGASVPGNRKKAPSRQGANTE